MAFYPLFLFVLILAVYRIFRPGKIQDRLSFLSLFLFLVLTFAVHPRIRGSYRWLALLEDVALFVSLLWLGSEPTFRWLDQKKKKKMAFLLLRSGKGPLFEIITACRMLADAKQGALIAIERKHPLRSWIQSGVPLEARVRRETIYSVFTPPGALHDGGMIVQEDRIAACGVLFPLSERLDLPTELGTRHRAAIGLSEATDALTLVISEETGKISFADRGILLYDVPTERLPEILEKALRNRPLGSKKNRAFQPVRRPDYQTV